MRSDDCRRFQERTREGWLYLTLAIVLGPMADNGALVDLHSGQVIGWPPLIETAFQLPGGGTATT